MKERHERVMRGAIRSDIKRSSSMCRTLLEDVERRVREQAWTLSYPAARALAEESARLTQLCAQHAVLDELDREGAEAAAHDAICSYCGHPRNSSTCQGSHP